MSCEREIKKEEASIYAQNIFEMNILPKKVTKISYS